MGYLKKFVSLWLTILKLPYTVTVWALRQTGSAIRGLGELISGLRPNSVLPPSVVSTIDWVKKQVPLALGAGSPQEQLTASVVVAVVMVVSSFGFLTPAAVLMVVPFGIGLLRLFPAFDDRIWSSVQSAGKSSRKRAPSGENVRVWKRD